MSGIEGLEIGKRYEVSIKWRDAGRETVLGVLTRMFPNTGVFIFEGPKGIYGLGKHHIEGVKKI